MTNRAMLIMTVTMNAANPKLTTKISHWGGLGLNGVVSSPGSHSALGIGGKVRYGIKSFMRAGRAYNNRQEKVNNTNKRITFRRARFLCLGDIKR